MQLDRSQNTAHHTNVTTVQQEQPADKLTDEQLMSALTEQHQSTVDELVMAQEDPSSEHTTDTQDYLTNELSDDELVSSLSQTEQLFTATKKDRQGITLEGVDSQSMKSNTCDTQHALKNTATSHPALEQANLSERMVVNDAVEGASTCNNADDENMTQVSQKPTWISCVVSKMSSFISKSACKQILKSFFQNIEKETASPKNTVHSFC